MCAMNNVNLKTDEAVLKLIQESGEPPSLVLRKVAKRMRVNGDKYYFGTNRHLVPRMRGTTTAIGISWFITIVALYCMAEWRWGLIYVLIMLAAAIQTAALWLVTHEPGKALDDIEMSDYREDKATR